MARGKKRKNTRKRKSTMCQGKVKAPMDKIPTLI